MRLRRAFQGAFSAVRENMLPGLLLQALMVVFLSAYVAHEGTRHFLAEVATIKSEAGYWFACVSYILSAAFLPEILRIAFFQGGRPRRHNLYQFVTAAPMWGLMGIVVDFFYRCQGVWFGTGNDWTNILPKVLVDQFVFSPFLSSPLIVGWLLLRDERFQRSALRKIFSAAFLFDHVLPVQVAGWCVWIPGVALVYFMPPLLQIPVAVLIQCFWVLILTTLGERNQARGNP